MKLPTSYTKAEEIQILESLATSDTYFAEYFKSEVDQMTSNIHNDFPIELNTKMEGWRSLLNDSQHKVDFLEEEIKVHIAYRIHAKEEITILKNRLRDILGKGISTQGFEVSSHFTFAEILKAKLEDGYSLTVEESNYLIPLIS